MKKTEMFEAEDGALFDTAEQCKEYERTHADPVGRLQHMTVDYDIFDKLLLFLVRDQAEADTLAAWAEEKGLFFHETHDLPAIYVVECLHTASEPIAPEELRCCRTSGELETLEGFVGHFALDLIIRASDMFKDYAE